MRQHAFLDRLGGEAGSDLAQHVSDVGRNDHALWSCQNTDTNQQKLKLKGKKIGFVWQSACARMLADGKQKGFCVVTIETPVEL
ncbi:hypothetical protein H4P12_00710 [Paracoccus sp. 11-3]|uniref:Uncharacterized protein n=1 Tax=Paracoccus amoyensis TaxID=2760093 RepID=A0A926GDQ0_9RHOB|nr:hypothetical protein [Paracoccus amoyensis]MBC9245262.1 hypothetical protein [Paracoccus amoyensis]